MTPQATLTEFLRAPNTVISLTDQGEVRITRRDAEDLVVLRASQLEHQQEGLRLASAIMRGALRTGDIKTALGELFAWTSQFTEDEMKQYAAEMDKQVWSATELGQYEGLLNVHGGWRETALAYAAGLPRGDGQNLNWLDESVTAEKP